MFEKIPIISNYWFIGIIAILTLILTMVTAKGGLTNHNFKWYKFNKRYKTRGKQAIGVGLLIGATLLFQEINNENKTNLSEQKLLNEQISRTKEINTGVKQGLDEMFNGIAAAFNKQGLQYDSIKKEVIHLRDSVRITQINGEPPLLKLTNLQIIDSLSNNREYNVRYQIKSTNATSYKINIKMDIYAICKDGQVFTVRRDVPLFYNGKTLDKNAEEYNTLKVLKDTILYSFYAFRMKGTYEKHDNFKSIKIDEFYLLRTDLKKNIFQFPIQVHEEALRNYLKERYNE